MKTVKEHACFEQQLEMAGGSSEDIAAALRSCNCRKMLTTEEATKKVLTGMAEWVILDRRPVLTDDICPSCAGGDDKETCAHCNGFGLVAETHYIFNYSATDIVLTNAPYKDEDGNEVFSPVCAKQTPRSATIEESHIDRAYICGNKEDQDRIEIYGISTLLNRVFNPQREFIPIKPEPADDPKEGTGRKHDWGRAYFAPTSDDRTSGGIGKFI